MELSLWIICSSCCKIQTLLDAADAGEIIEAFFKGNKGYFIAFHSSCSSNPYLLRKQKGSSNKGSLIVNDKPSWVCHGKVELPAEGPCACNLTTGMGRDMQTCFPCVLSFGTFFQCLQITAISTSKQTEHLSPFWCLWMMLLWGLFTYLSTRGIQHLQRLVPLFRVLIVYQFWPKRFVFQLAVPGCFLFQSQTFKMLNNHYVPFFTGTLYWI